GLTKDVPASLSPDAINGLLRGEFGFQGLVISDALAKNAVSNRFSAAEATIRFVLAGGDLAIINAVDAPAVRQGLLDAIRTGRLSRARVEESAQRVSAAKGRTCAVSATS